METPLANLMIKTKRLSASTQPELHLTNGDLEALAKLRHDLQHEVVSQYEDFLWTRKRNIDSRRWKFVRSESDLHAYTERESMSTLTSSAAAQLLVNEPQAFLAQQLSRSRIMVVGTVPGTLDDIMYAQTFHDTPSLRASWAYQNDLMKETAVLGIIEQADDEDPYRFSGISWYLRSIPILLRDRDALVFDDIRLSVLRNGERVGVTIAHSINHDDLPDAKESGSLRMTVSIVTVFRQYDANNVDVFIIQIIDNFTSAPEAIYTQRVTKAIMSVQNSSDIALSKKLHHLLRQRSVRRKNSVQSTRSLDDDDDEKRKRCQHCEKRVCKFGNPPRICQLCDEEICQKCVVTKELILEATGKETISKPFGFCVGCILRTGAVRALDLARADVREREHSASFSVRDKLSSVGSDSTVSC